MKILKKLVREEKGSITMTVLAAMLFVTIAIVISYFSISNQSSNQNRKIQQISKQYSVTDSQLEERYNQLLRELDNTSYMKINEIKSLGNIMLSKKTNTETVDTDGNRLVIPGGFKLSNEENTDKVENGLVIEDKDGNQWVWIPVDTADLAKMYESGNTEYTLLGTNVKTTYKTKEATFGEIVISRGNPGEQVWREPDVGSSYDTEQKYRTEAGFDDLTDMATKLKDEYKDMIESVKKNKGFYVGRYELGKDENNNPQVKAGTVMNRINWFNSYSACKSLTKGNAQSRMIWGCQWDQVCRFINEHGDKVSLANSETYGNYSTSTGEASTNKGSLGSPASTGIRNSAWKANNIYDIAGNCVEWTQEAAYYGARAYRGR